MIRSLLVATLLLGSLLPASAQDASASAPTAEPVSSPAVAAPVAGGGFNLSFNLGDESDEDDVSVAIQLLVFMTLLTLAPSIVLLMTSFMRIVIVLGFLRNAMGLQSVPPNQVIVGIAIFLTFFLMKPVGDSIYEDALQPFQAGEITSKVALERATEPLGDFMLKQTRPQDIEFFLSLAEMPVTSVDDLPMRVIVPSFVLSELRTAFQMGFMIFLPFLVVDFVVATVLMAMGMMMMPPVIVSLPFKVLLFVMVDGWYLIVRSLVTSF